MRRVRRVLRGRQGRWVLATAAAVAVLLIGLLVEGFLGGPAGGSADPTLGAARTPVPTVSSTPSAHHHRAKARKHTAGPAHGSFPSGIPKSIRDQLPDNPLNHLHGAAHRVTVAVTSAAPIGMVGYLVPTGLTDAYGTAHPHGRTWSLSEQALGPGYLAAVFVQSDRNGSPVTCSVTVDGKQTNSETASSPYARAVCLG